MRLRRRNPVYVPEDTVGACTNYYKYIWDSNWTQSGFSPAFNNPILTNTGYCLDECHPGPPFKSGGPLSILEYSHEGAVGPGYDAWSTGGLQWRAKAESVFSTWILDAPPGFIMNDGVIDGVNSTYGDVSGYGATGWNMYKPAKPAADLGVFLAEMRDIPRMMQQTAKFFTFVNKRGASSAFSKGGGGGGFSAPSITPGDLGETSLAIQFGWMPFLRDMCKFYNTYKTLEKRIQRIRDYNNKWERRGGTVSVYEDESEPVNWGSALCLPLGSGSVWRPETIGATTQQVDSKHVWFTAKFKYHIPEKKFQDVYWKRNAVRQMFGGTITPGVLWEATPWSWLIDWFSNYGDVFANMSDGLAENLVASYSYVMGTIQRKSTCHHFMEPYAGTGVNFTSTQTYTSKNRCVGNPFGFDLGFDDLSLKQLSILVSLGLTRGDFNYT